MVSSNPLFQKWTVKKFQSTVVNDIWPEIIFFSLVATMVALVSKHTHHQLVLDTGLLTVLGTVLGLVISFRTSSAYERYQDGRKMWTSIAVTSRNLSQMIWIHIPTERQGKLTELEATIEKKTMVNLVQAFSVACKHFLRGEAGVYYQDLYPLVCVLPRYASEGSQTVDNLLPIWQASEDSDHPFDPHAHNVRNAGLHGQAYRTVSLPEDQHHIADGFKSENSSTTFAKRVNTANSDFTGRKKVFDPEVALPDVASHRPLHPSRDPPQTSFSDYFPIFRFFKWIARTVLRKAKAPEHIKKLQRRQQKIDDVCQSNVPLEIILFLSSYMNFVIRGGLITPPIATGLMANLTSLQDSLSQLERIATTPLPFAYQAHLRFSLWLYLFFLPFQIYAKFGYLTIPGTAFATFLLVGFLEIGQEIENPFNYDLNDLDIDTFCLSIQRELHEITAHSVPTPDQYVFGPWNQPFAPYDRRVAADLLSESKTEYVHPGHPGVPPGLQSLRTTLVKNWRDVDRLTRDAPKNCV